MSTQINYVNNASSDWLLTLAERNDGSVEIHIFITVSLIVGAILAQLFFKIAFGRSAKSFTERRLALTEKRAALAGEDKYNKMKIDWISADIKLLERRNDA